MDETKIIYHIDDEDTPYLVKLTIPPDRVTLGDFKNVLNRPNYKFFFKSVDDDFGVVKEEIADDDAKLPHTNGRVVSWLVSAEGSNVSDTTSQSTDSLSVAHTDMRGPLERTAGIGDSRPPSFHRCNMDDTTCTESESVASSRRGDRLMPQGHRRHRDKHFSDDHALQVNGHGKHLGMRHRGSHGYESSSMMSSDIETTSFFDSEDETTSRISSTTELSSVSRIHHARHRRRRRKHRMPPMSRTSSFSSITDSTMSLNIITVTLNMDTVNFLGISIVGQSDKGGDGGIYVGSIMKGGAVALDGRIEPGDMILQVNDKNFENMSNDDAVRVLREVVQKPGPIKLVVAKCWDPNPKGYFTIPRTEPVRPIDPGAWVAHTVAVRGDLGGRAPSLTTLTSTCDSITSSLPDHDRTFEEVRLTTSTDMVTVVKAMAAPDSTLEIKDRMWLKIVIPNAFIGQEVVDWLYANIEGFTDRREARKYAATMLKDGYIKHTVNKINFSDQCYYVFGDICGSMSNMKIAGGSEIDRDTLGPLPPPSAPSPSPAPWGSQMPYGGAYIPQATGFTPMPFNYTNDAASFMTFGREGSLRSGSGGSSNGSEKPKDKTVLELIGSPGNSGSDSETASQQSVIRMPPGSPGIPSNFNDRAYLIPNPREIGRLESVPQELSASRQSFRMAMGNPCEYFVDVM